MWERLKGTERFYLKMLDVEAAGAKKVDNYQNFAKAFRVADYRALMASTEPNAARLKTARDFKRSEFGGSEFGSRRSAPSSTLSMRSSARSMSTTLGRIFAI